MFSLSSEEPPAGRRVRLHSYKPASGKKARVPQDLFNVLGKMAEGVFAVDNDYRIVFWNQAAQHMLGYSPEEILGKRCCDVLAGVDQYNALYCQKDCPPMTLMRIGQPIGTVDVPARTRAGKPLWINLSTLPIRSIRILVHFFRDNSLQRLIEEYAEAHGAHLNDPMGAGWPGRQAEKWVPDLTRRERGILRLLASGASTKHIAESLCISRTTVRNHVQNILLKLGAHSRLEAVAIAYRNHLLQPSGSTPQI